MANETPTTPNLGASRRSTCAAAPPRSRRAPDVRRVSGSSADPSGGASSSCWPRSLRHICLARESSRSGRGDDTAGEQTSVRSFGGRRCIAGSDRIRHVYLPASIWSNAGKQRPATCRVPRVCAAAAPLRPPRVPALRRRRSADTAPLTVPRLSLAYTLPPTEMLRSSSYNALVPAGG
jgi:hypothetical protein